MKTVFSRPSSFKSKPKAKCYCWLDGLGKSSFGDGSVPRSVCNKCARSEISPCYSDSDIVFRKTCFGARVIQVFRKTCLGARVIQVYSTLTIIVLATSFNFSSYL